MKHWRSIFIKNAKVSVKARIEDKHASQHADKLEMKLQKVGHWCMPKTTDLMWKSGHCLKEILCYSLSPWETKLVSLWRRHHLKYFLDAFESWRVKGNTTNTLVIGWKWLALVRAHVFSYTISDKNVALDTKSQTWVECCAFAEVSAAFNRRSRFDKKAPQITGYRIQLKGGRSPFHTCTLELDLYTSVSHLCLIVLCRVAYPHPWQKPT